jgi:hypothetical protein
VVELIVDRNRGLPWSIIAKRYGVTERQARERYAAWREAEQAAISGRQPLEVVYELLDRYEAIQGQLAVIAETAPSASTRVSALRAQMDAMTRQTDLMQASGLLPRRLGQLRVEHDVRVTAARIVEIFEQYGVPEEAKKAVVAAIDSGS